MTETKAEVRRYDIFEHSHDISFLRESADGDYVRWTDFDSVVSQLTAARERIAELEHDLSRAMDNHCADLSPKPAEDNVALAERDNDGVLLPQGVMRIDARRLAEILSGYAEYDAPDLFEIRSLAYEVRNSRAALSQRGDERDGWRPIESAPLNTPILILAKDICGRWSGFVVSKYAGENIRHEAYSGWSVQGCGCQEGGNDFDEPTHWQPLPEAPKEPL